MRPVQLRFRVRYAETDQMGVAHHANYLVWLEMGRVDLMTRLGLPYREVERRGVFLVVTNAGVRYRRPAAFDDELVLSTAVSHVKSRLVRFEYAIERAEDGLVVAEGFTEHVATDLERRTIPIPQYVRALLEPASNNSDTSQT